MNKIIKAITLICFVTMISGFVAYRSGAFDSEQKDLSNNPLTDNLQLDSPPVKKVIMHSSKSGKVIEPNENTNPNKNSDTLFRTEMMHSSKSGVIISPKDIKEDKPIMGSSKSMILLPPKKDTIKKKESSQQNSPAQSTPPSKSKNPNKK